MNVPSFISSVNGLQTLLEENDITNDVIAIDVEKISSVLHSEWMKRTLVSWSKEKYEQNDFHEKLSQAAINLWNVTVAKHASREISDTSNALLRQLCYDLICCGSFYKALPSTKKSDAKRNIIMAIKLGKSWIEVSNYEKASQVLVKVKKDLCSLNQLISDEGCMDWYLEDKIDLQKNLCSVLCHLAEIASAQDNRLDALNNIEEAGRLQIFNLPENIAADYDFRIERDRLTYNFGLESANRKQNDDAIRWLGLSFDSEKSRMPIRPKLLAQSLRLMAHVYSELRSKDGDCKALSALDLANSYALHPSGLYLSVLDIPLLARLDFICYCKENNGPRIVS